MTQIFNLTLENAIEYEKCEDSFNTLLSNALEASPGYDAFVLYYFRIEDEEVLFERIESGFYTGPPSIEASRPINRDLLATIPKGRYKFTQLVPVDDEKALKLLMLPFLRDKTEGNVYVRLYKEGIFECVMQLMLPL